MELAKTKNVARSMKDLMKNVGTFSSHELQDDAGVRTVSNRTVRRFLKRNSYGFYQCRRKGQITVEDLERRVAFCRKCKEKRLDRSFILS